MVELGTKGLRLLVLAYPLVGFQMVSSNFFQCLGMVNKAILLSMSRQLLFLIPCIYAFPIFFEAKGVWMSLYAGIARKFRKLNDGDDPSILGSRL